MGLNSNVRRNKIVKSYSYTNTIEYYGSTADYRRPKKKLKVENLSSITIGYLHSRKGSEKARDIKRMKILLDSGCGATLINQSLIGKLKTTKEQKCKWKTKAGNFTTNRKCKTCHICR